jgi:hypothetical protein
VKSSGEVIQNHHFFVNSPLSSGSAGDNQASDGGTERVIISDLTNVVKSQIQIHPIDQPFGGHYTIIDSPLFLG